MNLLVLQQQITDELDTAINEIFIKHQHEYNILDGGITPNESVWLAESLEATAEAVAMMISNQCDRQQYATANMSIDELAERIAMIERQRLGDEYIGLYGFDITERLDALRYSLLFETGDIIDYLEDCAIDTNEADEINAILSTISAESFNAKKTAYIESHGLQECRG